MDISKDEFKKMQDKYKSKHPDGTQAVHFPKKSVDRIINSKNADGLRVYFGVNDEGKNTLMLVATDEKGNNLMDNGIEDYGQLCPPFCGGVDPKGGE